MKIVLDTVDCQEVTVDRDGDGVGNDQGFDIKFRNGVYLHFENELDAQILASLILRRLGLSK